MTTTESPTETTALIAEPAEVAPRKRVRMGDTCGPEHTYREFCQYAEETK